MIADSAKIQYLNMLLRGETLCQFDTLCDQVRSTTTKHISRIILVLDT